MSNLKSLKKYTVIHIKKVEGNNKGQKLMKWGKEGFEQRGSRKPKVVFF